MRNGGMNIALMFSGQGAHKVGMGKDLSENSPLDKKIRIVVNKNFTFTISSSTFPSFFHQNLFTILTKEFGFKISHAF